MHMAQGAVRAGAVSALHLNRARRLARRGDNRLVRTATITNDPQTAPLRRWFGTVTAVRSDLLSDAARAKLTTDGFIARHDLRDRFDRRPEWKAEWENAVARGKALEAELVLNRTAGIAEDILPNVGGDLVRKVRDSADGVVSSVSATLGLEANGKAVETGKAAIGAGLTTPLTKAGVLSDVAFSAVTNVGEALLRGGQAQSAEDHVDTATAIAYDVTSAATAGVIGTAVGVVATPPVGIATAIATKLGIDAVRDPIVWGVAELLAGARAALSRRR